MYHTRVIRGFFLFYITMTHRLIIPLALHRRWFIIRAHPSLSLKGRHPRHRWPILFCSFTPLSRPSPKSNPSLPRRHSSLANDRFLYPLTHTHTHIDFSRKKIKIKEGKKVPSIKAKNNGPVTTRGRARPFDLLGRFVDYERRPRLHTRTAPLRMYSENRIPVKKLVSNSPPGPLYG